MNYIINPWMFYLLNILGHIVGWSIAGLVIASVLGVLYSVFYLLFLR